MSRLPPYYGAASDLDWRESVGDVSLPTCVDCDQPTTDPGRLCPTCREACGAVDDGPPCVPCAKEGRVEIAGRCPVHDGGERFDLRDYRQSLIDQGWKG